MHSGQLHDVVPATYIGFPFGVPRMLDVRLRDASHRAHSCVAQRFSAGYRSHSPQSRGGTSQTSVTNSFEIHWVHSSLSTYTSFVLARSHATQIHIHRRLRSTLLHHV